MSWTDGVHCWGCFNAEYHVVNGVWTCTCGHVMTVAEIKEMHDGGH